MSRNSFNHKHYVEMSDVLNLNSGAQVTQYPSKSNTIQTSLRNNLLKLCRVDCSQVAFSDSDEIWVHRSVCHLYYLWRVPNGDLFDKYYNIHHEFMHKYLTSVSEKKQISAKRTSHDSKKNRNYDARLTDMEKRILDLEEKYESLSMNILAFNDPSSDGISGEW